MLSEIDGIEVVGEAGNAQSAMSAIDDVNPDMVILETHLQGDMNGVSFLKKLKQDCPARLVLMLTSYPYKQYRKRCVEAGADYFFDKSREFESVAVLLSRLAQGGAAAGPDLNR